ncbi:MAG: CARDB domain-containing protein, partial [Candidatus Methanofastidiosia archaeon]
TSPSFHIYNGVEIWYFWDDGNGPLMTAHLETDKPHYGKDESPVFTLTVTDQLTGDPIKVDGIAGEIVLPDQTKKTVTTSMWRWNEEEQHYTCQWNLKNDDGSFSNPQEGGYLVQVTARKHLYKDASTSSDFMVCYDVRIDLAFDRNPPVYGLGETVIMTVRVTDEDGNPMSDGLQGSLSPPIGDATALDWTEMSPGVFTASYLPKVIGTHMVTTWLEDEDEVCYLTRASSSFEVVGKGEFQCSLSEEEVLDIAEMYSPYMYFFKDDNGEEKYFPTSVNLMIGNSTLWDFQNSESREVGEYASLSLEERESFISGLAFPNYYLDLNSENCTIDSNLLGQQGGLSTYSRVACYRDQGELFFVVQYWFSYIFNDHANNHEGEWEMVEVILDYASKKPLGAAYSRHDWGEYLSWDEIEKKETHPVVYVAEGSHAAYFTEGLFKYHATLDRTSNDGKHGIPQVDLLEDDDLWLHFAGNWGYRIRSPRDWVLCFLWNSGPHGPKYQGDKWDNPVGWAFSHAHNHPDVIRSPYTMFSLSCPADMLITSSSGEKLGFVNEEFVQEIPNSYVGDLDEEELYLVERNDKYNVDVFGTGEGEFDLSCVISLWNCTRTLKYLDIPVDRSTKASLYLDPDSSSYTLYVDSNGDGIMDFAVFPDSVQLYSPEPIAPLEAGKQIEYQIILVNEGDASTFLLDVDLPIGWAYELSSDTAVLDRGESAAVVVTVTVPLEISLQNYTIRVKATSAERDVASSLELTATSKSELTIEDIKVSYQGEDLKVEALISNRGLIDAEGVIVQLFNILPNEDDILGEQTLQIGSGETAVITFPCTLSDGFYTFSVLVDPENTILESCESNNRLSRRFLIDRTPPEARIYFDPLLEDIVVIGKDNLDNDVELSTTESISKNNCIRIYNLTDDAGNKTELWIEIHSEGHHVNAEIVKLTYNAVEASIPKHMFSVEYVIKEGTIQILNQLLIVENTEIHLIYNSAGNYTKILVDGTKEIHEGIICLVLQTSEGKLLYDYEEIRWVQ